MVWFYKFLYAHIVHLTDGIKKWFFYFRKKPRVTVVCWNLSHNPVGRAFLFADSLKNDYQTELVGPIFPKFGHKLWKPLRGYPLKVKSFTAGYLPDFYQQAVDFVEALDPADIVIICKPRLPSMLIGLLLAQKNNAKVILDIDDHELSFFENHTPISSDELATMPFSALERPFSEAWTRYCESLIAQFPLRTVSNWTLQKKFGGTILPHVRNPVKFNRWLYNRNLVRRRYGIKRKDKVILFVGTPRAHKGFLEIPEAVKKLNDPRIKVMIVGKLRNKKLKDEIDLDRFPFLSFHPDVTFKKLPKILVMADLICICQDPKSPVSKYQMPAKLSDAIMMGVPVIVRDVPPLKHLSRETGITQISASDDLSKAIRKELKFGGFRDYYSKDLEYTNARRLIKDLINKKSRHQTPNYYEDIIHRVKLMPVDTQLYEDL